MRKMLTRLKQLRRLGLQKDVAQVVQAPVVVPVETPVPASVIDPKADKILSHLFDAQSASPSGIVVSLAKQQQDGLLTAERLINSYHLSVESKNSANYTRKENDLWSGILEKEFADMVAILNSRDASKLVDYLMHFGESYTWFGGLCFSLDGYNHLNRAKKNVAVSYFDKLICLAEAVGAISLENPEQGAWGENVKVDVNVLIALIEAQTGTSLYMPQGIVPVTGIDTAVGPIHYRHVNSYYAAWRAKTLVGKTGGSVCEFGAGNGIAAYYAHRMGIAKYTTIDLPLTNVFSGWFLINAIGHDKVCLHGEPVAFTTGVCLLPSWKCADIENNAFNLVLNQDSFPEIDKTLLLSYFDVIQKASSQYFLSINHETESLMAEVGHSNVSKLLKNNSNYALLCRSKYWIREGYVEELYRISK
jgi:hypothetical protein